MEENLKKNAVKSSFWNAISQTVDYLQKFTIGLVIARLLGPESYGLIALVTVFSGFSIIFIEGGFSASLIREKEVNDTDFSTVFSLNLTIGFFLSVIFYLLANPIAELYGDHRVKLIVELIAPTFFVYSISVVHRVKLMRQVRYDVISRIKILVSVSSGLLSLALAYNEFGYFTLIAKNIYEASATALFFLLTGKSNLSILFSKKIIHKHWKYSFTIFWTNLLAAISQRLDYFLIGKYVSVTDLGLFSRARGLVELPVLTLSSIINQPYVSVIARLQGEKEKMLKVFTQIENLILFLLLPILITLYQLGEQITIILLGPRWLESARYLGYFCVYFILYVLTTIRLNIISILGFPQISARVMIIQGPIKLIIIAASAYLIGVNPFFILQITILFNILAFSYANYIYAGKVHLSYFSSTKNILRMLLIALGSYLASKIIYILQSGEQNLRSITFFITFSSIFVIINIYINRDFMKQISPVGLLKIFWLRREG